MSINWDGNGGSKKGEIKLICCHSNFCGIAAKMISRTPWKLSGALRRAVSICHASASA
jgi:hypothetical protein